MVIMLYGFTEANERQYQNKFEQIHLPFYAR